jgi:hypothetical protein
MPRGYDEVRSEPAQHTVCDGAADSGVTKCTSDVISFDTNILVYATAPTRRRGGARAHRACSVSGMDYLVDSQRHRWDIASRCIFWPASR